MASNVIKSSSVKNVITRSYAAQAAAAASQQHTYSLPPHQPQVSKLPKGGVVVSLENNLPISRVAVFVKSGSRYETNCNLGVSHMLRLCVGLATKNFSAFGLTRRTQQFGGTLVCQSGREHTSYSMCFLRDNLKEGFEMLSDVALYPTFKHWEVDAQKIRLMAELGAREPSVIALELLHKAAFRNSGLGHSIFIPDHRIGKVTPDQMHEFFNATHTSSRFVFVGLGMEHTQLVKLAQGVKVESGSGLDSTGTYAGGEIRHENGSPFAHIALAGPGAKIGSEEAVSLAIAQFILGSSPGTKYGSNASSKLASVISGAGGHGTAVPINANYTDGGLFGVLLTEGADKAGDVLRAISKAVRTLKISDVDVKNAKAKLKSAILMSTENTECELEGMGLQVLFLGSYLTASEIIAVIDKATAASVQSALSNAVKGKPSMGAFGGISNVPYLDEL